MGPLARTTVIDLTRVRAGPACARIFADWGADVVMVEAPEGATGGILGSRASSDFQNLHRNKRSLTLDLKSADGLEVLKRLVARADVLIENYRPDVKRRLGIGYERLSELNPRLVYGSISGFGQDGPYAARPGFDQIAQGMGGLMSVTGFSGEGPVRAGIPVADLSSGLFCALGLMAALIERETTGRGRHVTTSLLEAQISMMDFQAARFLVDGEIPSRQGNEHPTSVPTNLYETADGHINVAASGDAIWRRLVEALGASELAERKEYATQGARYRNREALNADLAAILKTRTSAAWTALLNAAGVPSGPVLAMDEVFADPQVRHLGMAAPLPSGGGALVAQPVSFDGARATVSSAAPAAGEHTDEILHGLGYTRGEIEDMRARKIV
jgi:formyl-CoA transferase